MGIEGAGVKWHVSLSTISCFKPTIFMEGSHDDCYYPLSDEVGGGGIGVALIDRPSGPLSAFYFQSRKPVDQFL